MELLNTDGGTVISYDRYGEGPPLVLVHGALSDSQSAWAMVKGLFGERFTVYAMNRRGRGESTATPEHRMEQPVRRRGVAHRVDRRARVHPGPLGRRLVRDGRRGHEA